MIDGMSDSQEWHQRQLERFTTHEGKREMHVWSNLQEYGVTSIIREQKQYCAVTYRTKYIDETGKKRELIWHVPNNPDLGRKEYRNYEESVRDIDPFPSLEVECKKHNLSNGFTHVLEEYFDKDLYYMLNHSLLEDINKRAARKRAEILQKHSEYGPNGENALDAIIASDENEYPSTTAIQLADIITLNTKRTDIVSVADILGGRRGTLVVRIKKVSPNYQLFRRAFSYCEYCFDAGDLDITYKEFDPPIKAENIKNHIPRYRFCGSCSQDSYPRIITVFPVTAWDLTLGHGATIQLTGVTVFNLAVGDIVAVDYVQEFNAGKMSLRCTRLQKLQSQESGYIRITASDGSLTPALTAILDNTDIVSKVRKSFMDICKRDKCEVTLTKGLTEIYNNGDADIRASGIFKIGDNGELIFDIAKNRELRNFRDSLTERRPGDDVILERIGRTPTRFKCQSDETN
jgi:hypothetical protein